MCRLLVRKISSFRTSEYRDIRSKRREVGSITIEAAIFLSMFIMFYMLFMDLVQVARAQVLLQYTINEVAKEISQYSYILTKCGIVEKRTQTAKRTAEFKNKTGEMIESVKTLGNAISSGNPADIIDSAQGTADTADNYVQYIGGANGLFEKLLDLLKTEGANIVSEAVIKELVKVGVDEQLSVLTQDSVDTYLKKLCIQGGLSGLDFEGTKWCSTTTDGMPDLEIHLNYTIDFKLGYFDIEPRRVKLVAKTALW